MKSAALATLRFALSVAVVAVFVAGCAKPPAPPAPTVIQVRLDATAGVNPDSRGRPSPVVVRLFELKGLAAFNVADFFSLWDREKEILGADLVARDEYQMHPGDSKKFERTLAPETKYVAVLVAYRDIEHATWRDSVAIAPNKTQSIVIECDVLKVAITRK